MKSLKRTLLCLIMGIFLLTGCEKTKLAEDEEMYTRRGFTIIAEKGLKPQEKEGYSAYYSGNSSLFTAVKEPIENLKSVKLTKDSTIEDYLKVVIEKNNGDYEIVKDKNVIYYTFEKQVSGTNYYNFQTAVKGRDSFWFVTYICLAKDKDDYIPKFIKWTESIQVK